MGSEVSTYFLRALEVLAKPGVGSGAADAASWAGHAFDHAVFDFAGFGEGEDFFAFGKAFCVFDVYGYIGVVFFQAVFDGSGYAACDGVSSSCCGCGLGFFREFFAGGGVIFLASKRPQSSSKVITKSTSLLTEWRIASSFLEAAWSDEDYFGVRVFFFTMRAVATIGVSSWEMLSIMAGKYFFAMTDQDGQQEVRRNGRLPVATSFA